jgi:hypothetical protein
MLRARRQTSVAASRILDERCAPDGSRLVVVCLTAERPPV